MLNIMIKTLLFVVTLIYGVAFTYSLTSVQSIEQNAKGFIKEEISKKTYEKIDNIGSKYKNNKLVKLSANIFKKKVEKLKLYKEALKEKAGEKLIAVMAKMKDLDCKCRKKYTHLFNSFLSAKILDLTEATKKLEEFMTQKYMYVVENLIKDFRIFLGSSLFIFLMMLVLFYSKPKVNIQIHLLAGLMMVSTLVSSYLYIFEQNWFFTIIYNDFLGYMYLLYLGIIFLLLCDIIFNKARVTTEIVNAILSALGSSVSAVSC